MLQNIIVVENCFEDSDEIVNFVKSQRLYSKEEYPNGNSYWHGKRSLQISKLNNEMHEKIINNVIDKCLEKTFEESFQNYGYQEKNKIHYNYECKSFIHLMTEGEIGGIHKDEECLYAGIIYLNKNPKEDCGTNFYSSNNKIFKTVKNKFNRLVLYNSNILHQAVSGFGNDMKDGRLTLVFYFKKISFSD